MRSDVLYFGGQLSGQEKMSHIWSVFAETDVNQDTRSDCHQATCSEMQPRENYKSCPRLRNHPRMKLS